MTVPARTRLAWRRTLLAVTIVALLAARLALDRPLAVVAIAAGWLAALVVTQRRVGMMSDPEPTTVGRSLSALVLVAVGYAVLGALLLLGVR